MKVSTAVESKKLRDSLVESQERDDYHTRNLEKLRDDKSRVEDLLQKSNSENMYLRAMLEDLECKKNKEIQGLRQNFDADSGYKDKQILGLGEKVGLLENKLAESDRNLAIVQMQLKKDYVDARDKIFQTVMGITDAKISNIDSMFMNLKN